LHLRLGKTQVGQQQKAENFLQRAENKRQCNQGVMDIYVRCLEVNFPEDSVNGPALCGERGEIFQPDSQTNRQTLFGVLLFGESAKVSVTVEDKQTETETRLLHCSAMLT